MSRRPGAAISFASKSMFDVLAEDDNHDEEGEEEREEQDEQGQDKEQVGEVPAAQAPTPSVETTPSSAPLSKSAKKKAAKLANQAAQTISNVLPKTSTFEPIEITSVSEKGTKENGVKGSVAHHEEDDPAESAPAPRVNSVTPAAITTTATPVATEVSPQPPNLEAPTTNSEVPSTKTVVALETAGPALVAKTENPSHTLPTSSFSPTLPSSLPQPTGNTLPSNRKRKTPQDFAPSGPNDVVAPSSPNKLAVKFEDGISPGEGRDGETIIQPEKIVKPAEKKNRNVIERTVWTFIMIGGFITLLCMGHPYMILLVMLCQTLVYKEVTALFDLRDQGSQKTIQRPGEKGDRWSKTLNWYFFVVTNYFLYGESIIYYFKHIVFVDAYFLPFAKNHRFISFMLYVVGFVGFVANLQRQYLRQQFALFCWVHISLLLIVVSSHFIVNNILEGLIWFFVPASLVICNDVMAYVCGKMFGRTPLIKLSPKKTVEGFVGSFIFTLIFGLAWGTFFMQFPYVTCPARDLGTNVFSHVTCKPNPVFVWREFEITGPAKHILQVLLGHEPPNISYAPFQIHVMFMATFASLVAPFGGFFASGFKRAFNIKDFGHSIPGHGGMTDRMDCQFMMGLFSYVYYSSLIRIQHVTVGSIMQTIVTSLSTAEQLELFDDVRRFLEGQGVKVK